MAPSIASHRKKEDLRRELDTLRDLPTPSCIVQEIWDALNDREASASALAKVLARDTALSGRVLRLANSAYFALPQPVADVRAACVVLGFEMLRGLAVGVAALDGFTRVARGVLDLNTFWRHSVAVATAARELARRLGIPDTGTAFCAGMLHDLGRLALAVAEPGSYRRFLDAEVAPLDRTRETEVFGAPHDEVGVWIAERWRLPRELCDAIGGHHAPEDGGKSWKRWGALVHVADGIARKHGLPCLPITPPGPPAGADVPRPAIRAESEEALGLLGITPDALAAVEAVFVAELERVIRLAVAAGRGGGA